DGGEDRPDDAGVGLEADADVGSEEAPGEDLEDQDRPRGREDEQHPGAAADEGRGHPRILSGGPGDGEVAGSCQRAPAPPPPPPPPPPPEKPPPPPPPLDWGVELDTAAPPNDEPNEPTAPRRPWPPAVATYQGAEDEPS